jgi:hypothetical protein
MRIEHKQRPATPREDTTAPNAPPSVYAPEGLRFIGVELDRISWHIACVLYSMHHIRIKKLPDARLPEVHHTAFRRK